MRKIILFVAVLLALFGCKKEESSFCSNAVVTWGGDPAADGLGWFLVTDSVNHVFYIPQNLPDSVKIDGQAVNVCLYKTKENFYCECPGPYKKYHITSIRKL